MALPGYGYNGAINTLRVAEFGRLGDTVYLDHAGTTLYSKSQVRIAALFSAAPPPRLPPTLSPLLSLCPLAVSCVLAYLNLLLTLQIDAYTAALHANVFGNPHSGNPSSTASADAVAAAREEVLRHFNTSSTHHSVIFTSGTFYTYPVHVCISACIYVRICVHAARQWLDVCLLDAAFVFATVNNVAPLTCFLVTQHKCNGGGAGARPHTGGFAYTKVQPRRSSWLRKHSCSHVATKVAIPVRDQ